jgi:Helix-turn-helix domain
MNELIDEKAAAALLGLSPATLRSWRCREIGPAYYRLGIGRGRIKYAVADLEEFTSRHVPTVRPSVEGIHGTV